MLESQRNTFDPEGTQFNELMYAVKMYGSTLSRKCAGIQRLFPIKSIYDVCRYGEGVNTLIIDSSGGRNLTLMLFLSKKGNKVLYEVNVYRGISPTSLYPSPYKHTIHSGGWLRQQPKYFA
jgi:hypothetical protein